MISSAAGTSPGFSTVASRLRSTLLEPNGGWVIISGSAAMIGPDRAPAHAGVQDDRALRRGPWIPASAGTQAERCWEEALGLWPRLFTALFEPAALIAPHPVPVERRSSAAETGVEISARLEPAGAWMSQRETVS